MPDASRIVVVMSIAEMPGAGDGVSHKGDNIHVHGFRACRSGRRTHTFHWFGVSGERCLA